MESKQEIESEIIREETILCKEDEGHRKVRFNYGLEPAVLSIYFAFYLTSAILQNQILKQMCLQLGYNVTICSNLNTDNVTKAVEEEVQPFVSTINSTILLLNSVVPAMMCLLLGSWTDKYGRKNILIMSFTGYTSTLGIITLFSYISDNIMPLTPWCYVIAELPMTFMGGWPALDIAICCYVTDLSDEKNRSFRLGITTFLNFLGSFSAYLSSSFILAATNASTAFLVSFSIAVTAFVYTVFMVDETVNVIENVSAFTQVREIFSFNRIKEIFKALFKKRHYKERRMIWFLMFMVTLVVFTMHGNGTVNYLFVREKFGWALREYTIFDSTNTALSVLGLFIGIMVLKKLLQISDIHLGILALTSAIIEYTIKAFATKSYHLYVASALGLFRLLSGPVFRSLQSTVIPRSEVGKIYSATTSFEALSGLGAGPLYSTVYNRTFTTFTGAFHLITVTVYSINMVLTLFVARWKSKRDSFIAHRQI